ncbi:MAG: YdcF family protein [Verrucomicrobiales bacterium]|nr:YdcF family protein [Verrucomicrobiales bacterium]
MSLKRKGLILIKLTALALLLVGAFVIFCNAWVILSTRGRVFDSIDKVEKNTFGLVLGTAKNVAPNSPNSYFEHRMAAAAKLYHKGKVRHLLVSGDGGGKYYNEPRDMTAKLVSLKVPVSALTSDDSGLRTLDSIIRAKKIYQLQKVTIISDGFHVNRALFIARKAGLDAIAFSSQPVGLRHSFKTRAREYLARVLVVLDLYVFGTQPVKMGDPVVIELEPRPEKSVAADAEKK